MSPDASDQSQTQQRLQADRLGRYNLLCVQSIRHRSELVVLILDDSRMRRHRHGCRFRLREIEIDVLELDLSFLRRDYGSESPRWRVCCLHLPRGF